MHDALFADQGRLEDPHLWARAERLGLDVARFDADRRADAVTGRVRGHFRAGVRAGVATTPTAFVDGRAFAGRPAAAFWALLARRLGVAPPRVQWLPCTRELGGWSRSNRQADRRVPLTRRCLRTLSCWRASPRTPPGRPCARSTGPMPASS